MNKILKSVILRLDPTFYRIFLRSKPIFIVIIIIGIIGNSACTKDKDENIWPPVPPIELPFDVQKVGNKVETEFQIIDHSRRFSLNLNYLYGDQTARKRAWELSGGYGGVPISSEKPAMQTRIPENFIESNALTEEKLHPAQLAIKLIISQVENNLIKPVIEKEINTHGIGLTSWGGSYLTKQLIIFPLEAGHYQLSVEVLSTSPELSQIPITFEITYPQGGK